MTSIVRSCPGRKSVPRATGRSAREGIVRSVPRTRLTIRQADPGVFIVTGEIDAHSAPELEALLGEAPSGSVILDMSGVEFIDSSGLRVLVTQQQLRTAHGHQFAVADPSVCVQRLFDMVGLTEFFIEPTISEPDE